MDVPQRTGDDGREGNGNGEPKKDGKAWTDKRPGKKARRGSSSKALTRQQAERRRTVADLSNRGLSIVEIAHQIGGPLRRHHMVLGQVHHRRLQARPVLHRRLDPFGKLAPVLLATGALRREHLVLRDLVMQHRQVKDLARFDHVAWPQRPPADLASRRRPMGDDVMRMRGSLQGMPLVPWLTPRRMLTPGTQRLRFRFAIAIRRRRLAGVPTVLSQPALQLGDLSPQPLNLGKQRTDQFVLRGNTEVVKIRESVHVFLYPTLRPLMQAQISNDLMGYLSSYIFPYITKKSYIIVFSSNLIMI